MLNSERYMGAIWLDRSLQWLLWVVAASIIIAFCWLLEDVVVRGSVNLSLDFLFSDPVDAGRSGGIAPILVSTLAVVGLCLAIALPLGLGCAIWLAEFSDSGLANRCCAKWVRHSLQVLAGVPSIVFGLFGYAFFGVSLGLGYSILSGALTLACMVLPLLTIALEDGLRGLPVHYRHSAAALALSPRATLVRLLLPAAAPALVAGVILSLGRALAETAALLFTSGYVTRMPESVLDSGRVLSIHIYDLTMNVTGGDDNAYASALLLLLLLFVINGLAKLAISRWVSHRGYIS